MYNRNKLLSKKIPLNFDVKTWFPIQWIATITYIIFNIYYFSNSYGFFRNFELVTTVGGVINWISIIFAQLYVYGGYITNSPKDIYVPAIVSAVVAVFDIIMFMLGNGIGLSYDFKTVSLLYIFTFIQYLILYIVYVKVEYREVKANDILGELQQQQEKTVSNDYRHFFL